MRRLFTLIAVFVTLVSPSLAQDRATLLADSLSIVGSNRLVAQGNVEILYQGQILRASSLMYDADTDRLTITGPIRIEDGKGNIILADQADLSSDLQDGILTSARVVLANRLQLAAAEVRRSEGGRFTGLVSVTASSCKVCGGQVPLWEIRAKSVLHDADAQQLYFTAAQLRFAGVPVFYLPRLRLPDPTLDRASGFLIPKLSSSTSNGFGFRLPYFLTLGPSRDLTITPFVTTKSGRTVELRYREALKRGYYTIKGAFSKDQLTDGPVRGYLEGEGQLALPLGFTASANGILVSDGTYLSDYGISNTDRLDSRLIVSRTQRNSFIEGQVIGFQSLRAGEGDGTLPAAISDLVFHRRFNGGPIGGQGGFMIEAHTHFRPSDESQDLNGDGIADGRDLGRLSFSADWRRNWTLENGMILASMGEVYADYYAISQDAVYGGRRWRTHGVWAAELRWPWSKTGASGAVHLVEPVLQLVLAPKDDGSIPNEDSALVEFDEANLFDLNRFPGTDGKEAGIHLNIGGNYLFDAPSGLSLGVTAGRVLRLDDPAQFSNASGLSGTKSDWLLAMSVNSASALAFTGRALLDDTLTPTKTELRFDLTEENYALALGFTDLSADPAEDRDVDTQEIVLASSYDLNGNWTALADARYDLATDSAVSTGAGLAFLNECLKVDLSVSRRFGSSTSVRPATDFGLTVELLGFGGGNVGPARQCRGK